MIWQIARVVARDAERLTLVISPPENCRRCARGNGCGAGVLARLFSRGDTRIVVPARPALSDSDWVRVGLDPKQLARAASLHYGLPLAGFLAGAVIGQAVAPEAAYRDLAALALGLAGFMLAAGWVSGRFRPAWNPAVERLSCTDGDTKSSFS